jgi:outer membrane protein insertion porin family
LKYLLLIIIFSVVTNCIFAQQPQEVDESSVDFTDVKYAINDVEFVYNKTETFNSSVLKDVVVIQKKKTYRSEDLELDRQNLKKFYFDNGFFNTIIDTSVTYNDEDIEVDIKFIIYENARYKFNRITYKNFDNIESSLKTKIFIDPAIKRNDFYTRTGIISEAGRIVTFLQDNGYPFARQDTTNGIVVEKYPDSNLVNLELSFLDIDKQYTIGKTRININNNIYNFEPALIQRELIYKEGNLYRRNEILQSERNFNKFALIQGGRIQIDTTIENEDKINLVANITLGKKYEFTPNILGVDIDNQFFAGAGIEYKDKNFLGGGRTLTIQLQGLAHSKTVNRIELSAILFQPYFIRNNITATYSIRTGFYNIDTIQQILSMRNLLRLNYFIADFTFYNNAYSDFTLDLLRIKYKKKYTTVTDTINEGSISNLMNSIIGLTLVHDNTDDAFNPTLGFFHSITVEDAGLLPRLINVITKNIDYSQYVKIYIPNRAYFNISRKRGVSVLATNLEFGDIIEYGRGDNIVPPSIIYRFFSGGSNSLRGWGAKQSGILFRPEDGGLFLFEGSLEYRWRTFANNSGFLKDFSSVYFVDYGNVWENHKQFRFDEIALAAGFGIRYNTFVGPLRLDFGFRLYDPRAIEGEKWLFQSFNQIFKLQKFAIQFGLGQAF